MTTLMEFLTSKEVFIVILLAITICIVGTIYFVMEKIYKNKKMVQNNNMENKEFKIEDNHITVEPVTPVQTISVSEEKNPVVIPIIENQTKLETQPEPVKIEKEEPVAVTTKKEGIPPVIPIEEYEKQQLQETKENQIPSIDQIYSEVKEQVALEKQEELVYTEIEPNKEEAQAELKKVTEELMKEQSENIDLTKFEAEQEENAIISMDELIKKSKQIYEKNEVTQYEDEGNEPISLADLEKRMNQIKVDAIELEKENNIEQQNKEVEPIKTVKLDDFNSISLEEAYKEDRIFKSSPVISPIFGIEKEETTTSIALENTANYEKLDEEIKKTNEFLIALKELQKKLE